MSFVFIPKSSLQFTLIPPHADANTAFSPCVDISCLSVLLLQYYSSLSQTMAPSVVAPWAFF